MLKIHYFLIAVYMSVFIYLIPLYYLDAGYTQIQVSILSSMLSFGAVVQPIFALIASKKVGLKKTYNGLGIILCLIFILFFFVDKFMLLIVLFLIYAMSAQTLVSFSDNIIMNYSITEDIPYGNFKKYCTLGWGIGVALCLPVIMLISPQYMFLFLSLIALIALFSINNSGSLSSYKTEQINLSHLKLLIKDKFLINLIIFATIFNGIMTVKSYYLSTLLANTSASNFFISLMPLALMIPEIVMLSNYDKIEQKLGMSNLLKLSVWTLVVLLLGSAFVKNSIILLLFMSLHGVISGLFLPALLKIVHYLIEFRFRLLVFLVITSMTYLVSGIISSLFIAPLLNVMSLNQIFILLAIITVLALIPLNNLQQKLKIM